MGCTWEKGDAKRVRQGKVCDLLRGDVSRKAQGIEYNCNKKVGRGAKRCLSSLLLHLFVFLQLVKILAIFMQETI